MNILKKLRGRDEEGEITIRKETNIVSKLSKCGSPIKSNYQHVFYLIDYEFRQDSVCCTMAKSLDPSEKLITVWVGKTRSKMILKRQYILENFQDVNMGNQGQFSLNTTLSCFADQMILC